MCWVDHQDVREIVREEVKSRVAKMGQKLARQVEDDRDEWWKEKKAQVDLELDKELDGLEDEIERQIGGIWQDVPDEEFIEETIDQKLDEAKRDWEAFATGLTFRALEYAKKDWKEEVMKMVKDLIDKQVKEQIGEDWQGDLRKFVLEEVQTQTREMTHDQLDNDELPEEIPLQAPIWTKTEEDFKEEMYHKIREELLDEVYDMARQGTADAEVEYTNESQEKLDGLAKRLDELELLLVTSSASTIGDDIPQPVIAQNSTNASHVSPTRDWQSPSPSTPGLMTNDDPHIAVALDLPGTRLTRISDSQQSSCQSPSNLDPSSAQDSQPCACSVCLRERAVPNGIHQSVTDGMARDCPADQQTPLYNFITSEDPATVIKDGGEKAFDNVQVSRKSEKEAPHLLDDHHGTSLAVAKSKTSHGDHLRLKGRDGHRPTADEIQLKEENTHSDHDSMTDDVNMQEDDDMEMDEDTVGDEDEDMDDAHDTEDSDYMMESHGEDGHGESDYEEDGDDHEDDDHMDVTDFKEIEDHGEKDDMDEHDDHNDHEDHYDADDHNDRDDGGDHDGFGTADEHNDSDDFEDIDDYSETDDFCEGHERSPKPDPQPQPPSQNMSIPPAATPLIVSANEVAQKDMLTAPKQGHRLSKEELVVQERKRCSDASALLSLSKADKGNISSIFVPSVRRSRVDPFAPLGSERQRLGGAVRESSINPTRQGTYHNRLEKQQPAPKKFSPLHHKPPIAKRQDIATNATKRVDRSSTTSHWSSWTRGTTASPMMLDSPAVRVQVSSRGQSNGERDLQCSKAVQVTHARGQLSARTVNPSAKPNSTPDLPGKGRELPIAQDLFEERPYRSHTREQSYHDGPKGADGIIGTRLGKLDSTAKDTHVRPGKYRGETKRSLNNMAVESYPVGMESGYKSKPTKASSSSSPTSTLSGC